MSRWLNKKAFSASPQKVTLLSLPGMKKYTQSERHLRYIQKRARRSLLGRLRFKKHLRRKHREEGRLDSVNEFEKFKDGGVLTEVTACLKRLSMKCASIHDLLNHLKYPKDVVG